MILVTNLAHKKISRTARVLRSGRRTGFLLEDGTRIRRRGRRGTELDEGALKANLEKLCEGIEEMWISVVSTETGAELTADDLIKMAGGKVAAKAPEKEPEKEPEGEDDAGEHDAEFLDEALLKKMKREELDELAEEYGLDPEDYKTKGEIIDALMEPDEEE